jgi:hypothetical protein
VLGVVTAHTLEVNFIKVNPLARECDLPAGLGRSVGQSVVRLLVYRSLLGWYRLVGTSGCVREAA